MQTDTARLEIRLLTPEELTLWLDDLPRLERRLECRYRAEPLAGDFRTIVEMQRTATLADAASPQWHSFWFLIRKRPYGRRLGGLQGASRSGRLCRNRLRTGPRIRTQRLHARGRRSLVRLGFAAGRRPACHRRNQHRRPRLAAPAPQMRIPRTQPRGNLSVDSVNGFSATRRPPQSPVHAIDLHTLHIFSAPSHFIRSGLLLPAALPSAVIHRHPRLRLLRATSFINIGIHYFRPVY